jgi:poly(3-hydroxybutyrate) depolymerase
MAERREKRKRWVQRGQYAVEVEVEVVYPAEASTEPCLEPKTVKWLDEIARRAEADDIAFLRQVGRMFQAVAN